jgi:hypothetical protein
MLNLSCGLLLSIGSCGAAVAPPQVIPTSQAAIHETAFDFYATNLRASLFSGCLTLGSFLLAVNTFIIVNLKKEVFEHDAYKERVRQYRKERPQYRHYGPLRNLSRVLLWTIVSAFVSAVLQLTLGMLWQTKASAVVCVTASVFVGCGVFFALVLVGITLRDWFNFLESETPNQEGAKSDSSTPQSR